MKTKTLFIAVVVMLATAMVLTSSNAPSQMGQTDLDRRQQCEYDCNNAYGGLDFIRPRGGDAGIYQGWSNCILRCNRDFWDNFDKDTKMD